MAAKKSRWAREAKFALDLALFLVGGLVVLMIAAFVLYFIQGVNSVQTYSPPIGGIMSFEFNLAQFGGIVLGAVFGLVVLLHQVPQIRKRFDKNSE